MSADYPISVRLPKEMREKIKEVAKLQRVSMSQIIVAACDQYLNTHTPGGCPRCHHANAPTADFCSKCGLALTESSREQFDLLMKTLTTDPDVLMAIAKKMRIMQEEEKEK